MIAVPVTGFLDAMQASMIQSVSWLIEAVKAIDPTGMQILFGANVTIRAVHVPAKSLMYLPAGFVYVMRGLCQEHVFGLRTSICLASRAARAGLAVLAGLLEDRTDRAFLEHWRDNVQP